MADFIRARNGEIEHSVTRNVDYLLLLNKPDTAMKSRAKQLSIKAITVDELNDMAMRRSLTEDAYNLANDRARLEHALRLTFTALGVGQLQQDKIIKDVRQCDFSTLDKLLKQEPTE